MVGNTTEFVLVVAIFHTFKIKSFNMSSIGRLILNVTMELLQLVKEEYPRIYPLLLAIIVIVLFIFRIAFIN